MDVGIFNFGVLKFLNYRFEETIKKYFAGRKKPHRIYY